MLKRIASNGATLIAIHTPNTQMAVINVLVKAGSAHEQKGRSGVAHFLEHMMYEGSQNYPDYDATLQKLMGENNAYTTQDYTDYYIILPYINIEAALALEIDRWQNLMLSPDKYRVQKRVIEEEFKETSIEPPLADYWHKILNMANAGSSYAWPVIGRTLEEFRSLELKDLEAYHSQYYQPQNLIFAISANDEEVRMLDLLERYVSTIVPRQPIQEFGPIVYVSNHRYQTRRYFRRNIELEHLYLAFPIADYGQDLYYGADMLSDILTNGESSILYRRLVKELQICSEISSYTTDNYRQNLMIIEAKVLPNATTREVQSHIWKLLNQLKSQQIEERILTTIKNKGETYFRFSNYSQLSHIQNVCMWTYCEVSESQYLDCLKAANPDLIQQWAQKIFVPQHLIRLIYSPYNQSKSR